MSEQSTNQLVRTFDTGATRSADNGKPDYEGYLSPSVIAEFGKYMTKHRHLPNGDLRASDNWQKGIPLEAYIKSLWRHFFDLWTIHRLGSATDHEGKSVAIDDTLSAMLFNTQGYFHETLKQRGSKPVAAASSMDCSTLPCLSSNIPVKQVLGECLLSVDCPSKVAIQIQSGTTCTEDRYELYPDIFYISGPMRGIVENNFPAFDAARNYLAKTSNRAIISPADIDRHDVSETKTTLQVKYAIRDFFAIAVLAEFVRLGYPAAIVLLKGWENSVGARAEIFNAVWMGVSFIEFNGSCLRTIDESEIKSRIAATL